MASRKARYLASLQGERRARTMSAAGGDDVVRALQKLEQTIADFRQSAGAINVRKRRGEPGGKRTMPSLLAEVERELQVQARRFGELASQIETQSKTR